MVRKGVNYLNIYLPTNDPSEKGKQKLVESLSDLDVILKPLAGEPIAVIGDFNLSTEHNKWRKDQFNSFLKKHSLTLHTPLTPTNFPRAENHKPAALDHLACTKHFSNVKNFPKDKSEIPLNVSTHIPVLWEFDILEEHECSEARNEEKPRKVEKKRIPRPNWRTGVDMELWRRLERAYTKTVDEVTKDLPAPWRAKTIEFVLAKAAEKAKIVRATDEEETGRTRTWFSNKIRRVMQSIRELKQRLAGEFYFLQTIELEEMFPGNEKVQKLRTPAKPQD